MSHTHTANIYIYIYREREAAVHKSTCVPEKSVFLRRVLALASCLWRQIKATHSNVGCVESYFQPLAVDRRLFPPVHTFLTKALSFPQQHGCTNFSLSFFFFYFIFLLNHLTITGDDPGFSFSPQEQSVCVNWPRSHDFFSLSLSFRYRLRELYW